MATKSFGKSKTTPIKFCYSLKHPMTCGRAIKAAQPVA
jgi:hypothetical protein